MPCPRPMRRQLRRWSCVASSRRGNHANGAASSRPSARITTSRSSITVTSMAVASNLTAEVDIPGLQKAQSVLDDEQPQAVQFMSAETARFRKAHRVQPKFGDVIAVLDTDVRRL